jgi:hypothetical protein
VSAHQTTIQWLGDNWLTILIWIWILGGFGWAADHWRRAVAARRDAAEIRHRRQVELALIRHGRQADLELLRRGGRQEGLSQSFTERWSQAVEDSHRPAAVPAAVIPTPPGQGPVTASPGPCRHERIVPVITDGGELVRWICANYPRCDAQFSKSVAIYEPAGEET